MIRTVPNLTSVVDRDGGAILNSHHNQITTLDAMGGYIWSLIERGLDRDQIVDLVTTETGENMSVVQKDLDELLNELVARRLLVIENSVRIASVAK